MANPIQAYPTRNKFPVIGNRNVTYLAEDTKVEYLWDGVTPYVPQNLFVKEVGNNLPNSRGKVSLPIETVASTTTTLRKAETKTAIADTDKAVLIPTTGNLFLTTWLNIKAVLKTYFDDIYEKLANKVQTLNNPSADTYPSTQAVVDYIGNPITHLNCFTHLTEFTTSTTTGNFLIADSSVASISGGWVIRKDGTGASAAIQAAEAGKPGILRLGTGTVATNAFRLTSQNIWVGSNAFVYEFPIRVQTLSTNAQDFYISSGIVAGSVLTPTDALRVFYNHNANGGSFVCERTSGGIKSTINTAVPLAINTWYTIRIVKYSNGTVEFFINGVSMGAASSTNVPSSISVNVGTFFIKTAGTTTRTVDFDYAYYKES